MDWSTRTLHILALSIAAGSQTGARAAGDIRFSQSAERVEAYDFVEITVSVEGPDAVDPFTDATIEGAFSEVGGEPVRADGFCDSEDGSVYRVRLMPSRPGEYDYTVTFRQAEREVRHTGAFRAIDGGRKGIVRVDREHPWHFLWEGSGEHYFYNGTTTYFMAGWDEDTIRSNLGRLARLKVNRVRAAISGRVENGRAWFENVFPTERFSFLLNPWVAARPDSVEDPGFDVARFNVAYWRKWDTLLRHARDLDVVVSVVFYVDGARPGVDPFGKAGMGGEDERRYYHYAVARLGAYSNVMWDISNEYRFFRDDAWAEAMGAFVKECDPYEHLASVHGFGDFHFRTSPWADFAMFQSWDESGGYGFMLDRRKEQADTGRPMPQVNEEYGYEDHYPTWGGSRQAPARSADNRRRLAWGMYMAGGYQTAGERADTGTGWGPDTGGGWLNGRGDDSMVMFDGYGHIVDFFTSIPWWELEPDSAFLDAPRESPVRTELTHVLYTRDADGQAVLYVDGQAVAHAQIPGDVASWDDSFRLALANELTRDRTWLGTYRRVSVLDRALPAEDAEKLFRAGPDGPVEGAVALYELREREGAVVRDTSEQGEPLDLAIADPAAVRWLDGGGLTVSESTLIASDGPATKVADAVRQTGCITVEAWIIPANTTQGGPARVVSLSKDPSQRNFTLGQGATAYEMRLRTTTTSANGEPSLWSPGSDKDAPRAMGMRTPGGDLAVVYLSAGGQVSVRPGTLSDRLSARWFNPRTGDWSAAEATPEGVFTAPDEDDWALLLQRP